MNVIFAMLGLTLTSFFIEFFSFNPGGLIVPVYFAINISNPKAIFGTFIISTFSFVLFSFLNLIFLIQKKHAFLLTIIISSVLVFIWRNYFPFFFQNNVIFESVGWIIPGILTFTMFKNGFFKTILFTIMVLLCLVPIYYLFQRLLY